MAAGLATAALSSRFIPPEKGSGLVMELPPYRLPLLRNLFQATWNRTKGYLAKAGTVILAVSVILWVLSTFPWGKPVGESVLGHVGRAISPVFAPLGFDWRLAVGLISGLAAKEVVVSTLALLAPAGSALAVALPGMMGPATALAFLVFVLLYTPCLATLAVMRSETGSRKWTALSLGWSLFLAYGAAFVVRFLAQAMGLAA
jgi:ferrous iron transport protein B